MVIEEYTWSPTYIIRKNVPFDGSSYYTESKDTWDEATKKQELSIISNLGVYQVSEVYLGGTLMVAFTESIDPGDALTNKLAYGYYGTKWGEYRILGTHKRAMLMCPNL